VFLRKRERENGNPTALSHATVRQVAQPAKESHTNNWSKELCKPVGGRLSLRAIWLPVLALSMLSRTPTIRFSALAKSVGKDRRIHAIIQKYVLRSKKKKK